jgi:ABC-2 type transport system ATP-binding protein
MARTAEPAVSVRGLRKRYGEVQALAGVDLDIARGEILALLGPNGAGKTTAVEILEGHRDRDGGEAMVLGEDPGRADRWWRTRIGIVLQTAYDAPELTVREAVRHFARYYPRPHDPDELVERVGLGKRANSKVRQLSPGLRRRLDVALGLVGKPELLFLDEPTTGFDPEARRSFWRLIEQLSGDGTTVLLTTHYLEEAEALADRVAILVDGVVVADDRPSTLAAHAASTATVTWHGPDGHHEERTSTPTRLIAQLAERSGGEVPQLSVRRPSLEDLYLELVEGAGADRAKAERAKAGTGTGQVST